MEIRYPALAILLIIGLVLYFVFSKKRKEKYSSGTKIANTQYVKKTDYYKKKLKEYNNLKKIIYISFGVVLFCSIILFARLSIVKTTDNNKYNRDIILCMDVSTSVDQLNIALADNLIDAVKELNGERFGISVFNTTSVMLVPVTDDYDYIIESLKKIKSTIKNNNIDDYPSTQEFIEARNYLMSGTLVGSEIRGSSLIGDGLASCAFSFPKTGGKRTRLIILSTDNELYGVPIVSLKKAAEISKSKNIRVYGVGTKEMESFDKEEFKEAVLLTNGKFYEHSNYSAKTIVKDIESTSKSLLKGQIETKKTDVPQIPFVILLVSFCVYIVVWKKVIK